MCRKRGWCRARRRRRPRPRSRPRRRRRQGVVHDDSSSSSSSSSSAEKVSCSSRQTRRGSRVTGVTRRRAVGGVVARVSRAQEGRINRVCKKAVSSVRYLSLVAISSHPSYPPSSLPLVIPAFLPCCLFHPRPSIVKRRGVTWSGRRETRCEISDRERKGGRERERERKCARERALSCDVIIACATVIDVRGGVDDGENDVDRDYRG